MAYRVHLDRFDGPLDLLLHLIEQSELDIKDIFISEITAQYLAYMEDVDSLDMDTASEFLTMAATLVYIKSRQLLPRPPKEPEEEEDPEVLLIRQLREYKAFKEASENLQTLYNAAQSSFTRLPEDVPLPPQKVELDGASMDGLYQAFLLLLSKTKPTEDAPDELHNVRPDHFTVRSQMKKIREQLLATPTVSFEELFSGESDRMEVIVTFMALLEMIAHGEVHLQQKYPFAPIRITALELLLKGDEQYDYMDELPE